VAFYIFVQVINGFAVVRVQVREIRRVGVVVIGPLDSRFDIRKGRCADAVVVNEVVRADDD